MSKGQLSPFLTESLLLKCDNRELIYRLIAFDVWVCNQDRDEFNLVAHSQVQTKPRRVTRRRLVAIDHGDCLVQQSGHPRDLSALLGTSPGAYILLDFLRDAIVEVHNLNAAIASIESLPVSLIEATVRSVPLQLLSTADRQYYLDFLVARAGELRAIFRSHPIHLPNLRGAVA